MNMFSDYLAMTMAVYLNDERKHNQSHVQVSDPGLTLPLAIVAICYQKCRVATSISHWLKVQSRWFKNYIFSKECISICNSFWSFYYCFYYSFTLIIVPDAGFFQNHPGVKQFGSRSGATCCQA